MIAEDESLRRPRRTRDRYLLGFWCSLAFLILLAGAIFYEPARMDSDTVVGAAIFLAVGSVPAAVTGGHALRWSLRVRKRRRVIAATPPGRLPPPPDSWVPPGPGAHDPDLAAQIPRLRVFGWRALGITVLWLAVFAGTIAGIDQVERNAQQLLDAGTRVTGTVLDVYRPAKGSWSIDVRYPDGAGSRTATVDLDSHREIKTGDQLTVVYDPADPARVRTLDDTNENPLGTVLLAAGLVASLMGITLAFTAGVGWLGRHRSVRHTGWHRADVVVSPVHGRRTTITATYPDGTGILLRGAFSTHDAARRAKFRKAWIGGEATRMVVLFHSRKPYAVPTRAMGPRK